MSETPQSGPAPADAHERLRQFLRGEAPGRLFKVPTCHPSSPTGFCYCEGRVLETLGVYGRGAILALTMKTPFNGLKCWLLRRMGAKIGRHVFFSADVWVDPVFPQLLEIEDDVFLGMGARITLHEFRIDEFRAGRVVIRRGAFVGAFSLIACGLEIGEGAVVAGGACVAVDVPAGTNATGNPAFIMKRHS